MRISLSAAPERHKHTGSDRARREDLAASLSIFNWHICIPDEIFTVSDDWSRDAWREALRCRRRNPRVIALLMLLAHRLSPGEHHVFYCCSSWVRRDFSLNTFVSLNSEQVVNVAIFSFLLFVIWVQFVLQVKLIKVKIQWRYRWRVQVSTGEDRATEMKVVDDTGADIGEDRDEDMVCDVL